MKQQIKELTAAIKNNRPALLLGAAGTAKTATVHQVAKDLDMPVETLLLAGILPEDLGGLVRPIEVNGEPTHFKYLAPEWAIKHGDKPFVLFLDEINQASIQTLHALFYVVNDRTVAGIKLPNMRVIAAGNTLDENEFLTPLPKPLLDRFIYRVSWESDLKGAISYLRNKYPKSGLLLDAVEEVGVDNITPRHIEQMIMILEDDTGSIERGRELVGAAYELYLKKISMGERHIEDNRLNELKEISDKIKGLNQWERVDGELRLVDKTAFIQDLTKDLTPEELELVNAA